jgi:hypothetical protein
MEVQSVTFGLFLCNSKLTKRYAESAAYPLFSTNETEMFHIRVKFN